MNFKQKQFILPSFILKTFNEFALKLRLQSSILTIMDMGYVQESSTQSAEEEATTPNSRDSWAEMADQPEQKDSFLKRLFTYCLININVASLTHFSSLWPNSLLDIVQFTETQENTETKGQVSYILMKKL